MKAYATKGLTTLYPWQAAALEEGLDCNLVYIAPTSGGKSLVAEILLFKRLVDSTFLEPAKHGKRRAPELVSLS